MRLSNPFTLLFLTPVLSSAVPTADTETSHILPPRHLTQPLNQPTELSHFLAARACNYNGCKCNSRGKQLTVCGNCRWLDKREFVVTKKRVQDHIFECSPKGDCCDYGFAKDCGGKKARCIIN